jgi:peptidoglycan/xylan/chitin deacetylase (PgdA/CDA1 family)
VGEFGSFQPDYRSWTQREYGLRIGVFRVLDALEEAGLRPAVAINAACLERVPGLIERLSQAGCEWLAHGQAANVLMHGQMPLDEQRQHIESALQACQRVLGLRPRGWLSQDWGLSPDTHRLLAEAGIDHTLDWCNDDQAYLMHAQASSPPLVAVPLSPEWDDVQCQWLRHLTPHAHARLALDAVDRLRSECQRHERSAVFGLALHPWVCGMSSRIGALRSLLKALAAQPDICWTQPSAIARQARLAATAL